MTFWSALADDQLRHWEVSLPAQPVTVRASAEDLAAALDALLENVIAHTPEGTGFSVKLSAADGGGVLEVADDGPGLPDDASIRGRSDRGSSGLGLDIARRCAEAGGGSMEIGNSPSGGTRKRRFRLVGLHTDVHQNRRNARLHGIAKTDRIAAPQQIRCRRLIVVG